MKKIKAIALFSGGLDSVLAARIMLDQGIDVIGVHFVLPFIKNHKPCYIVAEAASTLGMECRMETMGQDYLDIIRNPRYGYGSGINPCIDCKIYMLKQAKRIAEEIGAEFIVTGEVLGQRPMSQHRNAMELLEKDSGLKGRILRPLSAKSFPETIAEKEGWVRREDMLSISGRGRDAQFHLAEETGIDTYTPVAGGCMLTEKHFAMKMKDLLAHNENTSWDDVQVLNFGRHFRFGNSKIIVGRNMNENESLWKYKRQGDLVFELSYEVPGPTTILQGNKSEESKALAAALTLRYSDFNDTEALVFFGENQLGNEITGNISFIEKSDFFNITTGTKE
ncbi:MAG: hypothetical protein JW864_09155 [Spirochaetes bacterium]|nr:hypothetical protein [Spirochaetota bacterium]